MNDRLLVYGAVSILPAIAILRGVSVYCSAFKLARVSESLDAIEDVSSKSVLRIDASRLSKYKPKDVVRYRVGRALFRKWVTLDGESVFMRTVTSKEMYAGSLLLILCIVLQVLGPYVVISLVTPGLILVLLLRQAILVSRSKVFYGQLKVSDAACKIEYGPIVHRISLSRIRKFKHGDYVSFRSTRPNGAGWLVLEDESVLIKCLWNPAFIAALLLLIPVLLALPPD